MGVRDELKWLFGKRMGIFKNASTHVCTCNASLHLLVFTVSLVYLSSGQGESLGTRLLHSAVSYCISTSSHSTSAVSIVFELALLENKQPFCYRTWLPKLCLIDRLSIYCGSKGKWWPRLLSVCQSFVDLLILVVGNPSWFLVISSYKCVDCLIPLETACKTLL